MIGPTKDTFIQPLSIKEVLDELETFKNYYCRTFETAFEKEPVLLITILMLV